MGHNHSVPRSRRDFLRLLGVSTGIPLMQSPIQILIESLVLGAQTQAYAQTAGINPRRYLHILQQGAPPRWTFDLFLTPYSAIGFAASAQLGTRYNFSNSGASVVYDTVVKSGINVPHMWQFSIPAASGGTRPMDPLLTNLLQLRGIQVGNPDHGAAQSMQFMPIGAMESMTALSADPSTNPIPAVNLSLGQYQFKSAQSKSAVTVANGGNMLSNLLSPFTTSSSGTFLTNKNKLGSALDAALAALNAATEANHSGASGISAATTTAKDLLSTGFGNLTTTWNTLVAKYNSLVSRSLSPTQTLTGINDSTIVSDGTAKFQLNGVMSTDANLNGLVTAQTGISNLATHFAVAEYILTNNLSSSIAIGPDSLYNLTLNGGKTSLGADEHTTGAGVSLLANTYMNIAYAACLLELMDQLKAKGIFNDTVIVMGGEFGRSARADGAGSDHGYMGSSSSIYCGALNGPLVLGNIYNTQVQGGGDGGTWGNGAPVTELGRALSVSDWAATIAFLLRVPSPTTATSSLLGTDSGSGYVSLVEKARQV